MKDKSPKTLLNLFIAFARVGVLTFGGGMAMLPILEREVVENHAWASNDELMDYYAVGQCTPGIIAVNTATFIGHKISGTIGGIVATAGVITPSILIILAIASVLSNFSSIPAVQSAFAGIRACVCVLIFNSVIKLSKSAIVDKATLAIFIVVLLCAFFFGTSPVVFVLLSAAAGIALSMLGVRGK